MSFTNITIDHTNYGISNIGEVYAAKRPGTTKRPEVHIGHVSREGSRWLALPVGWEQPCKVATRKDAIAYLVEQHRHPGNGPVQVQVDGVTVAETRHVELQGPAPAAPSDKLAGEVRRATSVTGGTAVLLDAKNGGDWAGGDDGRWITLCEQHSTVCEHRTRKVAEHHLDGVEWCEPCMEQLEAARAIEQPQPVRVVVVGPNLNDQSNGEFHVHAEGCADLKRDANLKREDQSYVIEARSAVDVAADVYADQLADNADDTEWSRPEAYVSSFHFAPCVHFAAGTPKTNTTINHQESSATMSTTTQFTQANTRAVKLGDEWVVEHIDSGEVVGDPHAKAGDARAARKALPKDDQQTMDDNDTTTEGNDVTTTTSGGNDEKIAGLPAKTAEAYQLFHGGKSVKEIAEAMGVSTARVYGHKRAIQEAGLSVPQGTRTRAGSGGGSTRSTGTTRRSTTRRSTPAAPPEQPLTADGITAALESTVTTQLGAISTRMDAVRAEREQLDADYQERVAELSAETEQLEALLKKMEAVREAAQA